MNTRFVYDANGNPFHLLGTQIHEQPDGELTYECPHCGLHPVPRHMVSDLAKYARSDQDRNAGSKLPNIQQSIL
jgi:hypothetical protein